MVDWEEYWNRADLVHAGEALVQVGKTVGGIAISAAELDDIIAQTSASLDLQAADTLLDLCCGNGLITRQLALHCGNVIAVDFSEQLIATARRGFAAENIAYQCVDIAKLDNRHLGRSAVTKICMYEALQHFTPSAFDEVMSRMIRLCPRFSRFFVASVPDKDRIWNFYNTPERVQEYRRRCEEDTEMIGYWWTRREIMEIGQKHGLDVRIEDRSSSAHTAHYRFDVTFFPKAP